MFFPDRQELQSALVVIPTSLASGAHARRPRDSISRRLLSNPPGLLQAADLGFR